MIRMLVTDLDQTLLRTGKVISDYTVETLRKCREKGVLIAFATARSEKAAARFTAMFRPDVFIGSGGALATAGEEVLCRFDVPAAVSSPLIRELLAEPTVRTVLATNEADALASDLEWVDEDNAHYRLADFAALEPVAYLKVSLYADDQGAVERIAARYPMLDMLRYTGENLYRFASKDAHKWNAVKAVAARFGVPAEEVAAFGDDVNDVEMVGKAGVGVAMGNAIPSLKAVADFIADTNDNDGVAKWIWEHIL